MTKTKNAKALKVSEAGIIMMIKEKQAFEKWYAEELLKEETI